MHHNGCFSFKKLNFSGSYSYRVREGVSLLGLAPASARHVGTSTHNMRGVRAWLQSRCMHRSTTATKIYVEK